METKSLNRSLGAAKTAKKDEFYTQVDDIEKEMRHYKEHFKGQTVLCNCDDPRVSGFWDYFSKNFEHLQLKKLIATCYKNQDYNLFSQHESEKGIALVYTGDKDGNRIPTDEEIEKYRLKGNGGFSTPECVEYLNQADIVVTNPPFSLFREYVTQLLDLGKKFLVISNQNALSYQEVFKPIKENKMWLGNTHPVKFRVPDDYEMREVRSWRDEEGQNWRSLGNACWFTNLDFKKRHDEIDVFRPFNPDEYPEYDNYKAIEVSRFKDIPKDYAGIMGVPVTFLERYNPKQFEIVGCDYEVKQGSLSHLAKEDWGGKLDRGYVNGRRLYARILITNRNVQKTR